MGVRRRTAIAGMIILFIKYCFLVPICKATRFTRCRAGIRTTPRGRSPDDEWDPELGHRYLNEYMDQLELFADEVMPEIAKL